MENKTRMSRRAFLGTTAAAIGAVAGASSADAEFAKPRDAATRTPEEVRSAIFSGAPLHAHAETGTPPVLTNPNMLVIMVDQLFVPTADCLNLLPAGQATLDEMMPNISWLRKNSISFQQHYTAAIACTPSRGTHLTGLYSDQTAIYSTQASTAIPSLDPRFPTFGSALPIVNSAYKPSSISWLGKWHLSNPRPGMKTAPLGYNPYGKYGFQFKQSPTVVPPPFSPTYPTYIYPSPNGDPNQGQQPAGGGVSPPNTKNPQNPASYEPSDADIANEFQAWYAAMPSTPWLTVVSFLNPHDISFYPKAFLATPASFLPSQIPPPTGPFSASNPYVPAEDAGDLAQSGVKPILQSYFQTYCDNASGRVGIDYGSSWTDFLNYYAAVMSLSDQQVGQVYQNFINTSNASLDDPNTVVIFTADHGEYAGSHSLHEKSGAVYENAIRIPLYVHFPGMRSGNNGNDDPALQRNQLTSSVDFCPLILETATGTSTYRTQFPDWANRQSLYYYLYHPSDPETRVTTIGTTANTPFVLHSTDEDYVPENPYSRSLYSSDAPKHVRCLRTKTPDPLGGVNANLQTGAKLATYNVWTCAPVGNSAAVSTQYEFYDFTNNVAPGNAPNIGELGNNTPSGVATIGAMTCPTTSNNPSTQLFCAHVAALGAVTSVGGVQQTAGLMATEMFAPLTGNAIKWVLGRPQIDTATPLSTVNASAAAAYETYQQSLKNSCSAT